MENWLVGRFDSRRRLLFGQGFPAIGRFFGQVVIFALTALETLDQQFTPRGQFTIWGLTTTSTGAYSVEIRVSGNKGNRYNRSVNSVNLAGSGQRVFYLPELLMVQPTENVTITATDLSAANNNVSFLILGCLNG